MPTLSADQLGMTRKNNSAILRALASVGQVRVAEALGVSESTVSRWKDKEIDETSQFLAVLGVKVVDESYRCIDHKTLGAILHGHRMWVASIESPEQLTWD